MRCRFGRRAENRSYYAKTRRTLLSATSSVTAISATPSPRSVRARTLCAKLPRRGDALRLGAVGLKRASCSRTCFAVGGDIPVLRHIAAVSPIPPTLFRNSVQSSHGPHRFGCSGTSSPERSRRFVSTLSTATKSDTATHLLQEKYLSTVPYTEWASQAVLRARS